MFLLVNIKFIQEDASINQTKICTEWNIVILLLTDLENGMGQILHCLFLLPLFLFTYDSSASLWLV